VLRGHLRRNCDECSGALTNQQSPAQFRDALTVFRNVASYHCFQLLQDCTEWLLQAHGAL
jgi:DNA polymerase epsilon subunit 1